MALLIKQYPDLRGPFLHYNGEVTLWFTEKIWTYFRETPEGLLIPINGVTNTLKIVDKSAALIPWSIRQVITRAYNHIVSTHGRVDGFVELTVEDLAEALELARKEPDDILTDAGTGWARRTPLCRGSHRRDTAGGREASAGDSGKVP
jgi:hypothetical protein